MGSSSSRFGSGQSSANNTSMKRTKRKFSSLLCGLPSSTSHSVLESESPISSVENLPPASIGTTSSLGVSSSIFGSESVCTSSKTSGADSESCNSSTTESVVKCNSGKDSNSSEDKASTSYENQPIQESVQGNVSLDSALAGETHNLVNEGTPLNSSDNRSSTTTGQNHGNLNTEENTEENRRDVVRGAESGRGSVLVLSDSFLSLRMFGSGSTTSHPGLSDDESDLRSVGILLVDVVSLSSNIFSSRYSRETRRSSGRLFFDTLSRQSSGRYSDSPTLAFTAGLGDDLGSRDRWLLDLSGDLRYDRHGHGHSYGYSRSHRRHEERRHFRSEMLERRFGSFDEQEQRTTLCASGIHPDGTCSCGSSFTGEEASPLGSISRIVLLAQALSEVLDELHRQPLSLSMSMLSLPAPESLVDSFPLKSHKKMDASETGPNYVQQCYICLVDYEEGDKVRILPCQHEYHALCVDKWLKEVNGVCPVCRCNVSDSSTNAQAYASTS